MGVPAAHLSAKSLGYCWASSLVKDVHLTKYQVDRLLEYGEDHSRRV